MTGQHQRTPARQRRGQPVLVLGMVLAAWGGVRYVTWVQPFAAQQGQASSLAGASGFDGSELPRAGSVSVGAIAAGPDAEGGAVSTQGLDTGNFGNPSGWQAAPLPAPPAHGWNSPSSPYSQTPESGQEPAGTASVSGPAFEPVHPRMAAGHALLMAAGFAQMEIPPQIAAYLNPANGVMAGGRAGQGNGLIRQEAPYPAQLAAHVGKASRWSADGWLLWRDDTTTPVLSGRPSYGRSQMGAVVRYALAPSSSHRPQAHFRGSTALQGGRDREVAAGLSARPLAGVPLRVAAEMRVSDRLGGTEVRPAAYAVTELAPQDLPLGLRAEAYGQAGYVGGDYATAFVDGQIRVDGSVLSGNSGDFDLRAGAGAWGGAQKDAARLDVGPSASVTFRVGEGRGRIAADYRFRVGGDAQPSSGPALTLSAGF